MNPTIQHLSDRPACLEELVQWYIREWAPWYGPGGGGDANADLAACLNGATLPLCLIAHDSHDRLVGTASLRRTSIGSDQFKGLWLSAVLVAESHRRQGIGTALIAGIEAQAYRFHPEILYTSTDTADRLLGQRGWAPVGKTGSLRGDLTIWCLPRQ